VKGRRLAVLLLAVLALVAAGCGGDDASDASGNTQTTVVEETTGDEMTETDSSDDAVGALGENCAELAGIGSRLAQSLSGQSSDLDDAQALFDELADQVPDEIKDDYEVVAENFGKIAEGLKDLDLGSGGTPSAEDLAKLQELTASIDSAEVREASENISAWAEKNC
jgi:hypothetical protein